MNIRQLPSFADKLADFKKKGVDSVVAITVNDPIVTKAFAESIKTPLDKVTFVAGTTVQLEPDIATVCLIAIGCCRAAVCADFDASLTKALGMDVDLSAKGLGVRSTRYAMLVDNGKVTSIAKEASPGDLKVSSAEAVLASLK